MKKFRSEISWKIVGPIIAVFALTIFYIAQSQSDTRLMAAGLCGTLVFILFLIFGINYIITDDGYLKIRNGLFTYQNIPITDIHTIEKTNSILSAPAASFNRIEIKYNKYDSVVISPRNLEIFINELKKLNSKIETKL